MDDCPDDPVQYEYLEHTADVQLHAWGASLEAAFSQCVVALYGYMTDGLDAVDRVFSMDMRAEGTDLPSLLSHLLDEALYNFSVEPFFVARAFRVLQLDRSQFTITARGWGESFDKMRHGQGTEIKAITYSNMQIIENPDRCDVFVIVDI